MKLLWDIAFGMLGRRRRQTLVSVLGVALGVAFFIAIGSVMRGFQTYFINQTIDVAPHITMKDETRTPPAQPAFLAFPDAAVSVNGIKPRDRVRGIRASGDTLAMLEAMPGLAAAPVLTGQALLRYGARDVSASISGIDPVRQARVSNISKDMIAGRIEDLRTAANGIVIGDGLAMRLGLSMGDSFSAISPAGVTLSMKVVGLFRTGIQSLDQSAGYTLLTVNQVLQNRPNVVNRIEMRLADVTQAEPMARLIEGRFANRTESWEESNRNILIVFVIQNAIMYSVTGAILLVAAFGIFNIVSTVVFEKTRDIAIMKSLGFTEGDIQRLFLIQGIAAGFIGAILGCALGAAMIEGLAQVRFGIGTPAGNDRFLLARDWRLYAIGCVFALVSAAVAALMPARRAARLDPVQVIRGAG
ncbi:ABC transporter permease [Humitalea sp. 24SJ18S-53]|uniref:ABC transporter permease n=1 Tax=Humitalea sp. 24SJ18S-53 TaxID=3422307 RepID=UPI003D66899C